LACKSLVDNTNRCSYDELVKAEAVLTPQEMGSELIYRRRQLDQLELEFSALAAEFAATLEYTRLAYATPVDWIRVNCNMTAPQAADRLHVGKHLGELSESAQAMQEGEIGYGHLVVMARTAEALKRSKTAAPFDEKPVLAEARDNTVGKMFYICRHMRHALDAQGYAAAEAEAVEARSLEISGGGDGWVSLKGFFDSAGAAAVRKALEPLARKSGTEDHRERKRRLADALVELATGARPAQLQVTTSLETLMGMAGAPAAEMEFSLPISAKTVERMACDCSIVRVLLGADSSVIDVGRSTPKITPSMKRALLARDGGCRWPGCDRPSCWSQGHHFMHWIRGGPTKLDNLTLLCYHHHRKVHEGNWQLVKCDDGRLLTIPPQTGFLASARGPD